MCSFAHFPKQSLGGVDTFRVPTAGGKTRQFEEADRRNVSIVRGAPDAGDGAIYEFTTVSPDISEFWQS